jgi:dihydropyrimidinase
MDADIVVWYPEDEINEVVTNEMLHHDIDYTPFEGTRVTNWPR